MVKEMVSLPVVEAANRAPAAKNKIWPIDARSHQGVFALQEAEQRALLRLVTLSRETKHGTSETVDKAFADPSVMRDRILRHVNVAPVNTFQGKGIICAWPTRQCPVGCDYCFFDSNMKGKDEDTQWSPQGVDNLIQLLSDANMGELRLSGGGDPFVERKTINKLVEFGKVDEFTLVTSAFWAKTPEHAAKVLDELHEHHARNPHHPVVSLRMSVDAHHLTKLKPDGMAYMLNVVRHYMEKFPNDERFKLTLHTMMGDPAIDDLCKILPVKSRTVLPCRQMHGPHRSEMMEVIELDGGLKMRVRHAKRFYSDPEIDMESEQAAHNIASCKQDIAELHDGHVGLVYNDGEATGLNFGMYHDGRLLTWGGTPPDNEHSIYTDNYADILDRTFRDVVSLSVLEKGDAYANEVVSEVNVHAARRAYGIGLRDFYSRILFEEGHTRLYYALRVLQDYVAEGRITRDQMEQWPVDLRTLVNAPKEELMRGHRESKLNIVEQYIRNPGVTSDQLFHLFCLVCKHHYDVTPEHMLDQVRNHASLAPSVRDCFLARVLQGERGN